MIPCGSVRARLHLETESDVSDSRGNGRGEELIEFLRLIFLFCFCFTTSSFFRRKMSRGTRPSMMLRLQPIPVVGRPVKRVGGLHSKRCFFYWQLSHFFARALNTIIFTTPLYGSSMFAGATQHPAPKPVSFLAGR